MRRFNAIGIHISGSGQCGIVSRVRVTGTVCDCAQSGWPRATQRYDDAMLRKFARRSRTKTLAKLAKKLQDRSDAKISTFTVSKRLAEKGFRRRVALKRQLLTLQ